MLMLDPAGKLLLRNSIKNVEAHNKAIEEEYLWQKWSADRHTRTVQAREVPPPGSTKNRERHASIQSNSRHAGGRNVQQGPHSWRRANHADRDRALEAPSSKNFWLSKLAECKEADPDKWCHSGFRELYPEELQPRGSNNVDPAALPRGTAGYASDSFCDTRYGRDLSTKKVDADSSRKKRCLSPGTQTDSARGSTKRARRKFKGAKEK